MVVVVSSDATASARSARSARSGQSAAGRVKLVANRMLLWRALRDTSGVLSSNGSSTLQTYVLGEACERTQCLKVTCWAEELRITITVPCEVSNRGRFAVPAHMLRKILRGAGSEDVELEEKASQMLHAKCGEGDFVVQEHNPAEFPELEAEERMDSGLALSLDVTWLRSALFMPHRVVEWTRDDAPWTRGVLVDICGEEGKFVSMSRTQLAVIHRRARGFDDLKAMIPSRTVETLVCIPMSNRRTDNATLRVGSSAALFSIGEIEIYSKLLEVEHYPNWKPRLPGHQDAAWPPKAKLSKLVWERPMIHVANELGVSDVALKNHCVKLGLDRPPLGYWLWQGS